MKFLLNAIVFILANVAFVGAIGLYFYITNLIGKVIK